MTVQSQEAEVRLALFELQRYLSDELAPMLAAGSVERLLEGPAQMVGQTIQGWVSAQYRGPGASVPVSDYLFHTAKKIHLMSQLDLLEKESVARFLKELGEVLVGLCPEEDREMLGMNLANLGEADSDLGASPVEIVHRQSGSGAVSSAPTASQTGSSLAGTPSSRRLALLVERLRRGAGGAAGPGASGATAGDLLPQILASAAIQSRNGTEFDQVLSDLGQMGIDARMGEVFRSLGRSLSGWAIPADIGDAAPRTASPPRAVDAMRKIISMAASEEEGTKRFGEMVEAAVEQFNEGALVQAATMFDLAERIIAERKLNPETLKAIRRKGQEALSPEQLRGFAERPDKHPPLRKVLNFFPGLTVQGVMEDLNGEPRRDRRRLFLVLLEVHGAAARAAALDRLGVYAAGDLQDSQGFFLRNLVFLLRRIPRPSGEPLEKELELLTRFSGLENPALVIKEAISALGQVKLEGAEQALIARLHEMEQMLTKGETGAHGAEELTALLDRAISALADLKTPKAVRAIVEHALKRRPALGDTMARLEVLSGQDLSADRDLVARLVETLRSELPLKVLGFVVQQKNRKLAHLIQALSATPAAAVRDALEEIVQRFPGRDFAEAATKVLEGLGATSKPVEAPAKSFSGDLELFGLPSLLQTAGDSQLTGTLTLADREGELTAILSFDGGKILDCQVGNLRGEAAFFQMFETPVPGTFSFQSQRQGAGQGGAGASLLEVGPMVLEAVRRHDEFREARVLVPDGIRLAPTGTKPSRPPTEEEPGFLQAVWLKASSGVPAAQLEDALGVDSYRVRHLLAHWVEEGTLTAK